MDIVILFETVEGQTGKIVGVVAEQARDLGHRVTLCDTAQKTVNGALNGADRVILAAPVHERRHPRSFEAALVAARAELAARPTLMLSVSLKAAFPDGLEEARDYLIEMEMRTGLRPTQEVLVAGAVRLNAYDYYERQIVRHVALAGHEVALGESGREFTDWSALEAQVAAFLRG
ncbi:flavodoxin domain-containing protein [Natronohydrobacter thiooxidans]|uniref:flavodoxin domain-containing protein n=1 Tax=Natronohydrobacter thiooxidans TaxID=87172 RepID=UPI0008FF412F|nr:flavodoxin domain-containing protein [Natronohydrobacter thiooxidans]